MNLNERRPAANRLYEVFARYSSPGTSFCNLCYSPEQISYITSVPVASLDAEHGRKLLWEATGHWESADVFRHYLPRILELLGPPWMVDDLYPLHLFETLTEIGFHSWPGHEQEVVIEYLECVRPEVVREFDNVDRMEWTTGLATLSGRLRSGP